MMQRQSVAKSLHFYFLYLSENSSFREFFIFEISGIVPMQVEIGSRTKDARLMLGIK
jgi:hypothetical protein